MWLTMNRVRRGTHYGTGLAAAGAAYFLDPRSGWRRRALLRDQANRIAHQTQDFLSPRPAGMRVSVLTVRTRSRFRDSVAA